MSGPGLHFFDGEEEAAVLEALHLRLLSRYRFDDEINADPSFVRRFEMEMERRIGVPHVLGMNSCTSALLAALVALDIGPGDEVIVPGYTFIASIAAIAFAGAVPVLCEIDDTLNLDPNDLASKLSSRTKAVLAVHMLGVACDMDAIIDFCSKHGLKLIEDCAQACGATYHGHHVGSFGDAGAFSLNVFKTITAGDGGALSCRLPEVFERAFAFHDHGSKPFRQGVAEDAKMMGLNFRMHELTGAVAYAQVRKLDRIMAACRVAKGKLMDAIGELPGLRQRRISDQSGECSTLLVYLFDHPGHATAVAKQLGVRRLSESGKHVYANMTQLTHRLMPLTRGTPFHSTEFPTNRVYTAGILPYTDNVLSRAVALSVGVADSYLGAGFGIAHPLVGEDEIAAVAWRFRSAVLDTL